MHQYCNIIFFGLKNRKKHYEKYERSRKDEKNQRDKKSCQKGKINPVVVKNSNFKASVYYHIIYRYWQRLIVLR